MPSEIVRLIITEWNKNKDESEIIKNKFRSIDILDLIFTMDKDTSETCNIHDFLSVINKYKVYELELNLKLFIDLKVVYC